MQLLEREDAHAVLSGALAGARTARGRLVLVSGEAGIGKSALLRAFAAEGNKAEVLLGVI